MQKHAFVSYVRENTGQVDQICERLTASGADLWLDRNNIRPGLRWKDAIRSAIAEGAFFIACFSQESVARQKSYMFEELNLAIEELRLMPADRAWFIPLRLNECEIPQWSIGAGARLSDIQWIDLSSDWESGLKLLEEILVPVHERMAELYGAAARDLESMVRSLALRIKGKRFTVGFTGGFGVGISDLLRNMLQFHERVNWPPPPVYEDIVEEHELENVGRILDIRGNESKAIEIIDREVDLLVVVIPVSNRIPASELERIQRIADTMPCLVVLSKWDIVDVEQDTKITRIISNETGRPVVVFSREIRESRRLMNDLLINAKKPFQRNRFSGRRFFRV